MTSLSPKYQIAARLLPWLLSTWQCRWKVRPGTRLILLLWLVAESLTCTRTLSASVPFGSSRVMMRRPSKEAEKHACTQCTCSTWDTMYNFCRYYLIVQGSMGVSDVINYIPYSLHCILFDKAYTMIQYYRPRLNAWLGVLWIELYDSWWTSLYHQSPETEEAEGQRTSAKLLQRGSPWRRLLRLQSARKLGDESAVILYMVYTHCNTAAMWHLYAPQIVWS